MYLKKIDGPRSVSLPDGRILTRADLPPPTTRRWVASRKAAVVSAVEFGLVNRDYVLSTYSLSDEEFDQWSVALRRHGPNALKTTALQKFRQPKVDNSNLAD